MAGDSSYGGKWRVPNVSHHRFKVIPNLVREAEPFDDGSRSKQWEDANIVEGQFSVDRQRTLNQSIEFLKFRY